MQSLPENHEPKEAMLYKKLTGNTVQCSLCNRHCTIEEGQCGNCGIRCNSNGKLIAETYGRTLTMEIDPIEKKPLFHFRPGTQCLGISTYGCNFKCKFCQNWHISQAFTRAMVPQVPFRSPAQIVQAALDAGVEGIAYTYTEPTVFTEYALETMKLARQRGLYNVWVSNGYMSKECAEKAIPCLDAINIDLKGNDKFYEEMCGNVKRKVVLENIKRFHNAGVHLEVTNLIIPGYNDNTSDLREVAKFIAGISKEIPLHFSRFFPHWKLRDREPTPEATIHRAVDIAEEEGLHYVYKGNLAGVEITKCKKCGHELIRRDYYTTTLIGLDGGRCGNCGSENNIIV